MVDTIISGGPVMVPIILASVIALATFIERFLALRPARVIPRDFCVEFSELLVQDRLDDARLLCKKRECAAARIMEGALGLNSRDRMLIKERLEELGRAEALELERRIPILGTVASVAPLLGLLGTVGGMIVTFDVIGQQGLGNINSLAGGISIALVTTFAGLVVGIPALIANRYLLSRVDALLSQMEQFSVDSLELMIEPSQSQVGK